MTNIVIPMAGRGERFKNNGFEVPKPLIKVGQKTMIEAAIESLGFNGKYIFITRKYKDRNLNLSLTSAIERATENYIEIQIDQETEGPASSALLAREFIDNPENLIIANCDQIMSWNPKHFTLVATSGLFDGMLVTYYAETDKNSYCLIDDKGLVTLVREKEQISTISTNGIHFWNAGHAFVSSAEEMIKANDRAPNGEFYIAPSYNYLINKGLKIGIFHIPNEQHNAVGVPEDLNRYLEKHAIL